MAAVTVTLTLAQIAAVGYAFVAAGIALAGIIHEQSFVNPSYGVVLFSATLWPLTLATIVSAKLGGPTLASCWKWLKQRYAEYQCSHEHVEEASDHSKERFGVAKVCHSCGKEWSVED